MKLHITANGRTFAVTVPDEWARGARGWELIGAQIGAAFEQAVPGVRDTEPADPVPGVRASKAAKA